MWESRRLTTLCLPVLLHGLLYYLHISAYMYMDSVSCRLKLQVLKWSNPWQLVALILNGSIASMFLPYKCTCFLESWGLHINVKVSKITQNKLGNKIFVSYAGRFRRLPLLMELISEDILSKKCHVNLGHILNIYRVTFVIGNALLWTALGLR
jgi:hypothetical protein